MTLNEAVASVRTVLTEAGMENRGFSIQVVARHFDHYEPDRIHSQVSIWLDAFGGYIGDWVVWEAPTLDVAMQQLQSALATCKSTFADSDVASVEL